VGRLSRGMGRLGSTTRLKNSNTLDHYDITYPPASMQVRDVGGIQSEATQSVLEEDTTDIILPDSSDESKDSEIEDIHDVEQQSSLRSVHEAIGEAHEHDLSPKNERRLAESDGNLETKSIFRGSSTSSTRSLNSHVKGVRFAVNVTQSIDEASQPSQPSLTALEDEYCSVEADSVVSSALRRTAGAYGHFQQQNTQPSMWIKLNRWMSWSLIGSFIVRAAPCFWCTRKNLGVSATNRQILTRLNFLCGFFCVIQIIWGGFYFIIKFTSFLEEDDQEVSNPDENKPLISLDLWSLESFTYFLTLLNFILLIATMLAHRAIRGVNLVGSVRFMWVLFWLLPLQIFCMIGLFDASSVTEVKTKHWWDDPSMSYVRELTCENGTANNKCIVPIKGGKNYENETVWCIKECNATDCEDIRNEAQQMWNLTSEILYTLNGVWAMMLILLMWVTLSVLQAIITLPIVQRSKESNIPFWLILPIMGCFSVGYLLSYNRTSINELVDDVSWISIGYLVCAGLFALAAVIGVVLKFYTVLNGRQRRIKQGLVIIFITTIFMTLLACSTIFVTSLLYSLKFVNLPEGNFRGIACQLDMSGSCTGCDGESMSDGDSMMCPEWSDDDVKKVLETIMKMCATLAAIFIVYAMITLRYGFTLFNYVSRYQIEYV